MTNAQLHDGRGFAALDSIAGESLEHFGFDHQEPEAEFIEVIQEEE